MTQLAPEHLNGVDQELDETEVESVELTDSDVFHILQNERRRVMVTALHELGDMPKRDLAEHVAEVENDCSINDLNSQQRKRVVVALHQTHIPKLQDLDVIEVSHDRISLGPNAKQLFEYLDIDAESEGIYPRIRSLLQLGQ